MSRRRPRRDCWQCAPPPVLHSSIEVITGMRDADYADRRTIPKLRSIQFGNRDVKARAQLVFQTTHHLTPVFDRLRRFDMKFEGEESNGHSVSSFRFRVSGKYNCDQFPRY